MKLILQIAIVLSASLLYSCSEGDGKNKLYFVSSIHAQHNNSPAYPNESLKLILEEINPELVLCELTPLAFPVVLDEYRKDQTITHPRFKNLPEFENAILPLWLEKDYTIRPVSAWTPQMAEARRAMIQEIRKDKSRNEDWQLYTQAIRRSNQIKRQVGGLDPVFVHSSEYDSIVRIWTSVYSEKFNDDLGEGGWENINTSHLTMIETELDKVSGEGIHIAIVFGAGHKGWMTDRLKIREDIELIDMEEFVKLALDN